MQLDERRRTQRNLVIFTVVVLLCGWIGRGLDALADAQPGQSFGQLVWIVTPLVTVLLLRAFAGDGWSDFGLRPALRGDISWYAISLLVYPAVVAVILLTGSLIGAITMPDVSAVTAASLGAALPMLLGFGFVKNIFEEFAWRGFWRPKSTNLAASIVYGEIRLATNSVWPAVLMHTVGGLFVGLLVFTYPLTVADGSMTIFSLGVKGGLMIALMTLTGVLLRRWRLAHGADGNQLAATP